MTRLHPLIVLTLLGGCTTVGPDYVAPETAVADQWVEPAAGGAIDPAWWQQFGDPQLTGLIERALAGSPTVAEAEARLAEARANRDATLGKHLPQVQASGSATENRLSENGQLPVGSIPGFEPEYSLFDLGFDASWEIDFWGRRTREAQSAGARVEAAEARLGDALVMLSAEIARSYMDLRLAQAQGAEAVAAAQAAADLAELAGQRYRAGEDSQLTAEQARARASSASEAVARLRAQEAASAYRLATLVGVMPEEIVPELRVTAPQPEAPETILTGLRSELLRRRPDVRAAERDLAAATADIGVATADLFPRFSLMGGLGMQSRSVEDLADPDSLRFAIGPRFSWPIFSGGRIRAQIRAADARAEAAAARYDQAVITALADSEAAVNRYLEAQRTQAASADALAAQQRAFGLSQARFASGEDNRLVLESARLDLIASERALASAKAEAAQAAVALFKALGGAWQEPR
ncbi:MAG: RND transporter [Sphingomonadales bacterium 32-64-17]|nr:MAG: RND transporter [Sphingomonadales bacterium 32-64-17]